MALSFVEFASGFRNDLAAISEICRARHIRFFVDAIQGLGVLPLDVSKLGIDYLSADGHKWLLGAGGSGHLLEFAASEVEELHPVGSGLAQRRRSVGFLADRLPAQAARRPLGERHAQRGGHRGAGGQPWPVTGGGHRGGQRPRVLALTDRLCEGASRAGWAVYSSRRDGGRIRDRVAAGAGGG